MTSISTPLLSLSKGALTMPFEIRTMQWMEENRWEQNSVPHRHDYFVIMWVKEAAGEHLVDLDRFQLTNNTIYCIKPGQVHLFQAHPPVNGYVISFTPEFLGLEKDNYDMLMNTGLFDAFSKAPVVTVNHEFEAEMEDMVLKMKKEYANYFLLRSEILKGFLKIFLVYLTRQFDTAPPTESISVNKNTAMVKKFFSLLEKDFITKRMVAAYADELIVTANYLNEIVKKVTGFSASHHIQQRVILEAKRQAIYSDLSMKEIAYQLGFDDIAHFSKFFKNAAGKSFTDFRKQMQEQYQA